MGVNSRNCVTPFEVQTLLAQEPFGIQFVMPEKLDKLLGSIATIELTRPVGLGFLAAFRAGDFCRSKRSIERKLMARRAVKNDR